MKAADGNSLIDLCVKHYVTLEALFALAIGNGLTLDGELAIGLELSPVEFQMHPSVLNEVSTQATPETHSSVSEGQSLLDQVIQMSGSLEALFEVAQLNRIGLTQTLEVGKVLLFTGIQQTETASYFNTRGMRINTYTPSESADGLPSGILLVDGDGAFIIDFDNAYITAE